MLLSNWEKQGADGTIRCTLNPYGDPVAYPVDEYDCPSGEVCIKPLLHCGFGLFWEHKGLLIGAYLIALSILLCGNFMFSWVGGNVLLGPFNLGIYKMSLATARNQDTKMSDILAGFEHFLPAFIANILVHIAAFFGFWLLLIPGLLVFLTYAPTYFFIFEENMGFWGAMEASRKMTWGNKKLWLTLGLAILVINFAGLLCFVAGIVVTVPFSRILIALAYEGERTSKKGEARMEKSVDLPASTQGHEYTVPRKP